MIRDKPYGPQRHWLDKQWRDETRQALDRDVPSCAVVRIEDSDRQPAWPKAGNEGQSVYV